MDLHIGDILKLQENRFPLVKLQSCHFKMDNIIGADEFYKGDSFSVIKIDYDTDIFLYRNKSIYFIKISETDIFLNLTQIRKDKLKKLFGA